MWKMFNQTRSRRYIIYYLSSGYYSYFVFSPFCLLGNLERKPEILGHNTSIRAVDTNTKPYGQIPGRVQK